MATYYIEAVVHGRVNFTVEADSEAEAREKAYDHPEYPNFDKYYDSEVYATEQEN